MNSFRLNNSNYTNQKFNRCGWRFLALALGCFAISPMAQAVVPAPDGGYPGGNTAEGQSALFSLTSGTYNTAVGFLSLRGNTTGTLNTAVGAGTLFVNTANENTATGAGALLSNTTGVQNTANGTFALSGNTEGADNTASGALALLFNTTGGTNTADGAQALQSNTTGSNNTAIGDTALVNNTTGNGNTALGSSAGFNQTTGSGNVYIAFGMNGVAGENNSCYIAGIFGQPVAADTGTAVFVDSNGKLGTMLSSRRFKHDIKPMAKSSEAILALNPVAFHYNGDKTNTQQFGLIAEQVAAVNPDLVVRDKNGEIYSVRYDQVNAMLLNEFLKEHSKVERQEATIMRQREDFEAAIAQQQKEIQALTATVKEQASQIQKVRARLELSKPAQQTVVDRE